MTRSGELFLVCGAILALGVITVLQFKQERRYKDDDAPMDDAVARARRRFGLRQRGALSDGAQFIAPHTVVIAFAYLAALGSGACLAVVLRWWWAVPGHPLSFAGVVMVAGAVCLIFGALNMARTKARIDERTMALNTLFSSWRVERADIVGCRWLERYGGRWTGRYVEQVLYDQAGRFYRIPNVLKARIPHGSWVRQLDNLGDVWPRSWPS